VPAVFPALDEVAEAPPLLVCVTPTVLLFVAVEAPVVTLAVAVPVFDDADVLLALPPAFAAVLPDVSSLPPLTFPPVAVDAAPWLVVFEPVTPAEALFRPEFETAI
jgi:hypothetical protein